MKKFFLLSIVLFSIATQAQFQDIFASGSDADKFVTDFTKPAFKGLMYATSGNWITSAKPLKSFHIELNISASGAFVPQSDESFKFNPNDYQYLKIESGPDVLPTVMGNESTTTMKIVIPDNLNNEIKLLEFDAPDGVKDRLPLNIVPAPMVQLSMGLPLGSEVNVRYTPQISSDGGFFQILGLGVKHSISQYFPKSKDEDGKKAKRHFNLAAHAAFQQISAGYDDPDSDKAVHLDMNALSIQGIASLDYKLISLYSSIGYTKAFTKLDVLGTYKYTYEIQDTNGNYLRTETVSVTDPLKLDYDLNGMKFKAGLKLKLAFFRIFADYTLQEYPVATAGIGFKF